LWYFARLMLNLQRTIGINITKFSLNSACIYWNSIVFDRDIYCFFLNNTSKVYKELLVRCLETIQHICMNILILNKTITFAWFTRIMQISSVRPKLLGSGNHTRLKRLRPRNQRHESRTMPDPSDLGLTTTSDPSSLGLATKQNPSCLSLASWIWQAC
jgi:hypothetical protein